MEKKMQAKQKMYVHSSKYGILVSTTFKFHFGSFFQDREIKGRLDNLLHWVDSKNGHYSVSYLATATHPVLSWMFFQTIWRYMGLWDLNASNIFV